jgi:hypothetical protein
MLDRALVDARPYIMAEARRHHHFRIDPWTGSFAVVASTHDVQRGLEKLASNRGRALRLGRLRGAAARDFFYAGRLAKLAKPFAEVAGPIGIIGGFLFDFKENTKEMGAWDAAIQSGFTTGGEVFGGALGAAACGAETFVTAGLGSAACPLLVAAGIVSGHVLGSLLGTGARWAKHRIGRAFHQKSWRIAPGATNAWYYRGALA